MHNAKSLVLLYYGFYPQLMAGWMAMAMVGDRRNCNQLRNDGYFGIEGRQPQGMHCTAAIFLSICLKSYWITKKRIFGRFDLRCALQFFFCHCVAHTSEYANHQLSGVCVSGQFRSESFFSFLIQSILLCACRRHRIIIIMHHAHFTYFGGS